MKVTIGIFEKEEGVLEAIQAFQSTTTGNHNLRIFVKNNEAAPILAAQSDVPVEEVYEIRDAQGQRGERIVPAIGAAPIATGGYVAGGLGVGASPGVVIGSTDPDVDERARTQDVLHDIGIPGRLVEVCGDAIEQGKILLLTETETEAEADVLLRRAGASNIILE
ncbi:hypothetical protein [Paenibacillus paridis]|uniref:hypothetical protein n=1 Tax=Paenibacillus paridis TaxID=2583376 RepID=UPI00111F5FD7|nr:hypothetical protein [Paenibacillus paridis]